MSWAAEAGSVAVARACDELGIPVGRHRVLGACPACQESGGGSPKAFPGKGGKDRWYCFRCSANGDVVDLVAYALTGAALPRGHSSASEQVRAWFASRGWCAPDDDYQGPPPTPRPRTAPEGRDVGRQKPPPPRDEIRAFLGRCRPTPEVPEVEAWLRRRLGPAADLRALVGRGIVGAMPEGAVQPRWASYQRQTWDALGYRVILPLYDAGGAVRSVRARNAGTPPEGAPKALPPAGHSLAGFVMADPLGRLVLEQGAVPSWWRGRAFRLVVVEGEPAFLAWCVAMQGRAAVLGIVAGSWTDGLAARVPDGARVTVCTDHDKAGDAYAERISSSLLPRCHVYRWTPSHARSDRSGGADVRAAS